MNRLLQQGTYFAHPVGVVISANAQIGKNCIIWQNVTIGAKSIEGSKKLEYPRIGDNVHIYAGAVIIGDIDIGDNCVIGANAVVTKSFPANSTIIGIPAKKII